MNKIRLTREEVNDMREVAVLAGDADIVTLVDAFLAQEEELEEKNQTLKRHMESIIYRGEMIKRLEAENQALKAKLAGTFKFDEPKRGEILRYTTDGATGDEGEDGGQP